MKRILGFILCFTSLLGVSAKASAPSISITPNGAANGNCTANLHDLTWFNNSANWGAGATQIGPATVVLLCGSFTASAGAVNYVSIQGSGTNGSPITIKWDTNTIVQAPYFGNSTGGINTNGNSWIVFDGGTNGIVQNTANGTNLTYHNGSNLFYMFNGSNITVKNLSVLNAYVHVCCSDHSGGTADAMYTRSVNNLTVGPGNTLTQYDVGVYFVYDGGQHDLVITGNNFSHGNQAIEGGPASAGGNLTFTNISVDHNTYLATNDWDDDNTGGLNNGNNYHHNFFHPFTNGPGSITGTLMLYDNTISGNFGNHATSALYLENISGGTMGTWYIFNNTFDKTANNNLSPSGLIAPLAGNGFFLNNTIRDAGDGGNSNFAWTLFHDYTSGWTLKNNIIQTSGSALFIWSQSGDVNTNSNNNFYYNPTPNGPFRIQGTYYNTLAAWRAGCNCDSAATGIGVNPNLNADMTIPSTSPAINVGANLSSLGIAQLNVDKAGNARPATGAWSLGAYAAPGGTTTTQPNAPTNVQVIVN